MKKLLKISLAFFIMATCLVTVSAAQDYPKDVKATLRNFVNMLNNHDELAYEYVDSSNEKIKYGIDKCLDNINLSYSIKNVTALDNENESYMIKVVIDAKGTDTANWHISGILVYFQVNKIDGKYVITDTDLFDKVGSDMVIETVSNIFKVVWIIVGGSFAFVIIFVIIILIVVTKNKNKNLNNNVKNKEEVNSDSDDENTCIKLK